MPESLIEALIDCFTGWLTRRLIQGLIRLSSIDGWAYEKEQVTGLKKGKIATPGWALKWFKWKNGKTGTGGSFFAPCVHSLVVAFVDSPTDRFDADSFILRLMDSRAARDRYRT